MKKPSILTLHTENEPHILDHIAPLADLLNVPLILNDEECFQKATFFYPNQQIELRESLEFSLQEIAERADILISCKYFLPHLSSLFETLYKKKISLIFCPHGQSDKGFQAPLLAPYINQEMVFLYGALQKEMLQKLDLWEKIKNHFFIGNYRLHHYKKNQAFFKKKADEIIFSHLKKELPTLLYAPTWNDSDQATSFFSLAKRLAEEMPTDWNLIVKPHPLLEKRATGAYYQALNHLEKIPNLFLLDDCPFIYPLLEKVDVYLGDASSIGYDFLFFNRPLFFAAPSHLYKGPIRECGQDLNDTEKLYKLLEKKEDPSFQEKRACLYPKAFQDFLEPKFFL